MNDELNQADARTLRKLKRIVAEAEPKGFLGASVNRAFAKVIEGWIEQAEQTPVKRELVNVNVYASGGQSAEDIADKVQRGLRWTRENYS